MFAIIKDDKFIYQTTVIPQKEDIEYLKIPNHLWVKKQSNSDFEYAVENGKIVLIRKEIHLSNVHEKIYDLIDKIVEKYAPNHLRDIYSTKQKAAEEITKAAEENQKYPESAKIVLTKEAEIRGISITDLANLIIQKVNETLQIVGEIEALRAKLNNTDSEDKESVLKIDSEIDEFIRKYSVV